MAKRSRKKADLVEIDKDLRLSSYHLAIIIDKYNECEGHIPALSDELEKVLKGQQEKILYESWKGLDPVKIDLKGKVDGK